MWRWTAILPAGALPPSMHMSLSLRQGLNFIGVGGVEAMAYNIAPFTTDCLSLLLACPLHSCTQHRCDVRCVEPQTQAADMQML